jgi:hypothetical protein
VARPFALAAMCQKMEVIANIEYYFICTTAHAARPLLGLHGEVME